MVARNLRAGQTPSEIVLVVTPDEARVLRDSGDPDPAYVRRFAWPLVDPANVGETRRDRLARIRQEARTLARDALDEVTAEAISRLTGQAL